MEFYLLNSGTMGFLKQRDLDPTRSKAAKRLRRLPDDEILNWADNCGTTVAANLYDYRNLRAPESLKLAREAAQAMMGALDVLEERITG